MVGQYSRCELQCDLYINNLQIRVRNVLTMGALILFALAVGEAAFSWKWNEPEYYKFRSLTGWAVSIGRPFIKSLLG